MLNNNQKQEFAKKLFYARLRVVAKNGFFGMLLMPMRFLIDKNCKSASTDGKFIYFNPDFLDSLSDRELEYVILHELLHCVMGHICRAEQHDQLFEFACDIVVNATIRQTYGSLESIKLGNSIQMWHIPGQQIDGEFLSAEDAYLILKRTKSRFNLFTWDDHSRWKQQIEANDASGGSLASGAKGFSAKDESDCKNKKEGNDDANDQNLQSNKNVQNGQDKQKSSKMSNQQMHDKWTERVENALSLLQLADNGSKGCGSLPAFAKRMLGEQKEAQTDWRTSLIEFVQQEVNDYTFSPPDRRFDDSPFFLPDYNQTDDVINDVLFMVDTSGSMSNSQITDAYNEVRGAIEQFNGKLKGWFGFFDAQVVKPKPFQDENEFKIIRPYGGGGTSFHCIFDYVQKNMQDNLPVCIIILTDGHAPFPKESSALGIPVLWVVNNKQVTPPWGKTVRIR